MPRHDVDFELLTILSLLPLQGVNYAVYGLGNKQYEHFNAVGKKVFKALGVLGGAPLIRRGDGDDDGELLAAALGAPTASDVTSHPI